MKIKYRASQDKRCKYLNKIVEKEFPHFLSEENPELIFVPGGDGALLHAIQGANHYHVPFFGYAAGTLNFLMNEVETDKISDFLKDLENNNKTLSEISTTMISVEIVRKQTQEIIQVGKAVNEVVIGTSLMGYHSFLINSKDGSFKDFDIKGSGVCLSTDLGSTGYNFNLGGAVLPLGSNLWSILGIVCNRYLEDILGINEISVECISKNPGTSVYLDGIKSDFKIKNGDKVIMKKGDPIRIAFLSQEKFFEKRIDISSRFRKG